MCVPVRAQVRGHRLHLVEKRCFVQSAVHVPVVGDSVRRLIAVSWPAPAWQAPHCRAMARRWQAVVMMSVTSRGLQNDGVYAEETAST